MAAIEELVSRIERVSDCAILPSAGLPQPRPDSGDKLPADLARFYELCGGAELFTSSTYGFTLPDADGVVPVDLEHLGKVYEGDISASWYIAAESTQSSLDVISIDLAPERLGRCYCSFFELHRNAGSCPIVATSFTDLLQRLLDGAGGYFYWWVEDFQSLGDAYDGYEMRWIYDPEFDSR